MLKTLLELESNHVRNLGTFKLHELKSGRSLDFHEWIYEILLNQGIQRVDLVNVNKFLISRDIFKEYVIYFNYLLPHELEIDSDKEPTIKLTLIL